MKIILASKSPRRKEILEMLGIEFSVLTSETDETISINYPTDIVRELSARKGLAVKNKFDVSDDSLIISSDTVVCCDNEILGKPTDKADAVRMLKKLSGKTHKVITGLSLLVNGEVHSDYEETNVTVKPLTNDEIDFYTSTAEPYDKAGAYGIQGVFSLFTEKIEGNYFNVVGLPTNLLYKMLKTLSLENIILNSKNSNA